MLPTTPLPSFIVPTHIFEKKVHCGDFKIEIYLSQYLRQLVFSFLIHLLYHWSIGCALLFDHQLMLACKVSPQIPVPLTYINAIRNVSKAKAQAATRSQARIINRNINLFPESHLSVEPPFEVLQRSFRVDDVIPSRFSSECCTWPIGRIWFCSLPCVAFCLSILLIA